jgi:hypothetical protein
MVNPAPHTRFLTVPCHLDRPVARANRSPGDEELAASTRQHKDFGMTQKRGLHLQCLRPRTARPSYAPEPAGGRYVIGTTAALACRPFLNGLEGNENDAEKDARPDLPAYPANAKRARRPYEPLQRLSPRPAVCSGDDPARLGS